MTTESRAVSANTDPAAVFACALSLWKACHEHAAKDMEFNLSECFNGIDQLMREVLVIGERFEEWACEHIKFDDLCEVWSYLLEEKFGRACLVRLSPETLSQFNGADCLWVALHMRLPVIHDEALAIPIDITAINPIGKTGFREFRIQTVRNSIEDGDAVPFVADDDPFDAEFGERYFGLYGVGEDGRLEHIADRKTYSEIRSLAQKLAPGIDFPTQPTFARNPTKI